MLSDAVRPKDIAAVIARATGIPVENLMMDEADKLLHMEDKLRARVVGQVCVKDSNIWWQCCSCCCCRRFCCCCWCCCCP